MTTNKLVKTFFFKKIKISVAGVSVWSQDYTTLITGWVIKCSTVDLKTHLKRTCPLSSVYLYNGLMLTGCLLCNACMHGIICGMWFNQSQIVCLFNLHCLPIISPYITILLIKKYTTWDLSNQKQGIQICYWFFFFLLLAIIHKAHKLKYMEQNRK